jgi:hypothetical protein
MKAASTLLTFAVYLLVACASWNVAAAAPILCSAAHNLAKNYDQQVQNLQATHQLEIIQKIPVLSPKKAFDFNLVGASECLIPASKFNELFPHFAKTENAAWVHQGQEFILMKVLSRQGAELSVEFILSGNNSAANLTVDQLQKLEPLKVESWQNQTFKLTNVRLESSDPYSVKLVSVDPKTQRQVVLSELNAKKSEYEDHEIEIDEIRTSVAYRNNDLTSLLLFQILKQNPEVQKISTNLAYTNQEVAIQYLLDHLKSQPQYQRQEKNLNQPLRQQFAACCSQIPVEQYQAILVKAIQQTPSYKIRAKFGFTEIKNPRLYLGVWNVITLTYDSTRP